MKKEYNKQNHPNALGYCGKIAARVREGVAAGLTRKDILNSIQSYGNAPKSFTTLYKIYGEDIEDVSFKMKSEIGNAVMKGVREGNPKLVEFAARAKAGWNPVERIQEVDDDDLEENSDAITTLAQLLGKEVENKDES